MSNNKPYEKFLQMGAYALSDVELLAIILRTGTKNKDACVLAKEVLTKGDAETNLLNLYNLDMDTLMSIQGIGEVKAVKILCITELSKRISMQKARKALSFQSPRSIAAYFMEELRHRETECLVLVCLNSKGDMLGYKILTTGSVRMSPVPPREIFIEALHQKAVNIILIHNHPSGDSTPSKSDLSTTKEICMLGKTIGIPLLDHIIIGDNEYYSFLDNNQI